jgi:hypothetical protein
VLVTGAAAAVAWAAQPPRVVAAYAEQASAPRLADMAEPISAPADLAGADDWNFDLDNGDGVGVIVIDGEVVHPRDLTPEQREELRQTLADARAQVEAAQEEMAEARQAIREAMRVRTDGLSEQEMEEIRQAVEEARVSQEEMRQARLEAMAEAQQSMREAQAQMAAAQIAMRDMPDVRAALREAELEITRAMEEARAAGASARAGALARAAAAIDAANAEDVEDPSPDGNN